MCFATVMASFAVSVANVVYPHYSFISYTIAIASF